MESGERVAASPHLREDEDVSRSVTNQLGAQSPSSGIQDQRQPRLQTDGWEPQPHGKNSFDLEFQDSNLSPTLSLLPVISGVQHSFPEFSLFQQSDSEFAPLRAHPDISMASGRFDIPPQDQTTHFSDRGSLSQHPLAQETSLSEEGTNSYYSCSQHSYYPSMTVPADIRQERLSRGDGENREKNSEIPSNPRDKHVGEAVKDETVFLSQHDLELLEKEAGIQSSSVSSTPETPVKCTASFMDESKHTKTYKLATDQSMIIREALPGEAFLSQQHPKQPGRVSSKDQSQALSSKVSNIPVSSRAQPGDVGEVLHREQLSGEQLNSLETQFQNKQQKMSSSSSLGQSLDEVSEAKPREIRANVGNVLSTGPFSAGVESVHRAQDLWSSGNQTGIDGSYLGFLPQSQSTPGVFLDPTKSSVKPQFGKLSTIKSNKDNSDQSSTAVAAQPARYTSDSYYSVSQCQDDALQASAEVQSLPSLSYMEKVDAWQANQSLGKTPLFDSLALQELSGISPKKKAYDSVSDTLNRILTHQASSSHQLPVSDADNHKVAQSFSTAPSGSSPRRGEAVGGAPSDKDKKGPAATPSGSPLGKSQSFSSFKTVVMSVHKHQQTDMADMDQEKEASQCQDDTHHHLSTADKHSPLKDLGHFSDVSLHQDSRLSCSLDSYSGIKVGASIGTSSIVSLELDNYAPYWTSKLSTPPPLPGSQELSIDERIPLYLHNLGINHSPSKILNPFVARGVIREPEFSPTDFCTIKGSTGTPLKRTQPSDGGGPFKGEFSKSSLLSVGSSVSMPFSLDSLGPGALIPEQARTRTCPPSDTEAIQAEGRLAPQPQSDEDESSHSSTLQSSQVQDNRRDIGQIGNKSDSNVSTMKASWMGRSSESLLQSKHRVDQGVEDSFVSTKALSEICKVLSHAENVISPRPSATCSAFTASRPLSDENIFTSSKTKTSFLQNSSFSSTSTAEGLRPHTSVLWTRSSSDSMLTSEKKRQSSVGREAMSSSQQIDNLLTNAVPAAPTTVTFNIPQDCSVNNKGTSLVLSKSAQRTEPEGCSAAPPDKAPAQLRVINPSSAMSTQQLTAAAVRDPEEEEKAALGVHALDRSSSLIIEEGGQEVSSDGSSESSLTVRVARLLQKESPATVVSSTPSITDQEESRATEWIKVKTTEQRELLELDIEDRKQIEEIKTELQRKNPLKSLGSTDTESSAASSVTVHKEQHAPHSAETLSALSDTNNHRGLGVNLSDSSARLHGFPPPDLEAHVYEIAQREGVNFPAKKPQVFTSIPIATCKHSTFPLFSSSPLAPLSPHSDPLHLTDLSTGTVKPTVANEHLSPNLDEEDKAELGQETKRKASVFESSSRSVASQSVLGKQKRQDTLGGQLQELPSPFYALEENMVDSQKLSDKTRHVSDVDQGANQATGPPDVGYPTWTGHHSFVHPTQCPKATDYTVTSAVHSSHADAVSELPRKAFVPLRGSSFAASSPDEGVGSCSPVERSETRTSDRSDPSLFKNVPQGRATAKSLKSTLPHHRSDISARRPTVPFAPVPVLLPYKPRGSEELFYVPQAEADLEEPSDTTMESSHAGSDDAVPPRFSSEVLGHQDPGLDRGITFRHTEGIYNKKVKTAAVKMQEPERRDVFAAVEKSSPTASQTPASSFQVSVPLTRVPPLNKQEVFRRDQRTSPVQVLHHEQREPRVQSVHAEKVQTRVLQDRQRSRTHQSAPQRSSTSSSGTLDQLWEKFCDRLTTEESCVASDGDASLVERLERLSRLIRDTSTVDGSELQKEEDIQPPQKLGKALGRKEGREGYQEGRRGDRGGLREVERIHLRLQAEKPLQPAKTSRGSPPSFISPSSSRTSPAHREDSETLSTTSGSMSTVDTERLIRVFGAHKVQRLKSSSGLSKLYSTVNKQRDEKQRWTRGSKDPPHSIPVSGTSATDEAVSSDSASVSSTYTLTAHHRFSRTSTAKKTIKLVNKSVQAGDLEIISNGTRQYTRDVGTTFPSPGEARGFGQFSSSLSSVVRGSGGGLRSFSQSNQKQRKSKRTPSRPYPEGVSWFISAETLKSEARKENRPEKRSAHTTRAWFERYSRVRPWREPLRQRQVHEDGSTQQSFQRGDEPDPDPGTKTKISAMAPMSLQEALEMHRPEFISRSRRRMQRLTEQMEVRKLQAVFRRDRGELYHHTGEPGRLLQPAGTAHLRRAVPRREMIQRSKQMYEKLPEVQRRRAEERRKAEYRSFRLKAQLYNKRITNQVLGRRSAWK